MSMPAAADPARTLPIHPVGFWRLMRRNGLVLVPAAAVFLYLAEESWQRGLSMLGVLAGAGLAAGSHHRLRHPRRPQYVLSPAGIGIHLAGALDVVVPWTEIRDVRTGSVSPRFEGVKLPAVRRYDGVTMAAVSRDAYERLVHVDSLYRRGPGWSNTFVPEKGLVWIAFHHEVLDVGADDLRTALDVRRRAFGAGPGRE